MRTDSLGPPKLVRVKGKVATCWLVDRRQSKHGQTAPPTSAEARVDQGCEGPPPQPDRHASQTFGRAFDSSALGVTQRLSRFTRLELNAAPRKATRTNAGVDDLPRSSGNGAQRILDVGRHPSVMAEGVGGRDLQRRRSLVDPDNQPVEHAYKLIRAHDYNFTGRLSVVNFWSWLVGLRTCGELTAENLLHFFRNGVQALGGPL